MVWMELGVETAASCLFVQKSINTSSVRRAEDLNEARVVTMVRIPHLVQSEKLSSFLQSLGDCDAEGNAVPCVVVVIVLSASFEDFQVLSVTSSRTKGCGASSQR